MNQKKLYSVLHKFTGKDDRYPGLFGIWHTNGYLYASDAYTAAKLHYEEYDFDFEGQVIDKNGKELEAKYPNIEAIIPTVSDMDELTDELVTSVFEACQNLPNGTKKAGEFVALNIEGFFIHTCHLIKVIDLFEVLGETPQMFIGRKSRPIIFKSENCLALVMPEVDPFGAKDLLFTIEEALEFKN